jgi:hypothetical protein
MAIVGALLVLAGPLLTLGIWLWLRSRRDPIALVEPLDIGRVFSLTFRVFTRDGWPVVGLAAVLVGLPQILSVLVTRPYMIERTQQLAAGNPANPFAAFEAMMSGPLLIGMVVGLLLMTGFYVAATLYLVSRFEGAPLTIGEVLARTPGRILPAFGVGLLAYLGMLAGMCLFFLPGIVLALGWSVAIPVVICESVGFFGSFGRSRELAIGSRGRILLLFVLMFLLIIVVALPGGGMMAALNRQPNMVPGTFAAAWQVISGTLLAAFQAGIIASLYVELRRIRDGMTAPGLAEVFA